MQDFTAASKRVLQFLQEKYGLGLWMVTRVSDDDWIILTAEDVKYGVQENTTLRWSDSFCSRMVEGLGPNIAPDASLVPAYKAAPIGQQLQINAYVGYPLKFADGSLFGTLCAIDTRNVAPEFEKNSGFLALVADLLSSLLQKELQSIKFERELERAQDDAHKDVLTGLYNRRGWLKFLEIEEARCRRYGNPASVIAVDLDGLKCENDTRGHAAGDALIQRAAKVLKDTVRGVDLVARTGGDEFMILCIECDVKNAQGVVTRLTEALEKEGVSASVGMAMRTPESGLYLTAHKADENMYKIKAERKQLSRV